jgi:hypothetical protein
MEVTFRHRSCTVTVRHGGRPADDLDADEALRGQTHFLAATATVWIAESIPYGTPAFYGILAHELVHLAGFMVREAGAARPGLGPDEGRPAMAERGT